MTVDIQNVGSSSDEYKALDNAIQAGSGVPDLVQFEYFAVPYFAIPGKLADLSALGADEIEDEFVAGAWNNVKLDGSVYAIPSDYGPVVMFYNQEVFAQAGVENPPATWDEFYEAAKKIRALGDDYYIANDSVDLFLLLSLVWQAGGRPYTVDGADVKINFDDAGSAQAVEYWQKMIDEDLVTTSIQNWSDEWNRALNEGKISTQVIGGWLTSSLPDRAPDAAGDFRVAAMPQWNAGDDAGAENGGSSMGIPEASQNKELAWEFLEFATAGEGLQSRVDAGVFVPNVSVLESDEFQSQTNEFFGDQEYGKVLADAAQSVDTGWQYPPFFEWARSVYPDVATEFYTSHNGSLSEVLSTWTDRQIEYGNQQGFTVE